LAGRPKEKDIRVFYDQLYEQLAGLDIAILINNAGVMYTGSFDESPADSSRWKDMIDINVMHVGMMTTAFRDKLIKRKREQGLKSAIINVSSTIGYLHGAAGCAVYTATKGFVHFYTMALSAELKDDIDIQCMAPGFTRTNLLNETSSKANALVSISAEDCAKGSLRDLGYEFLTSGDWRHDFQVPFATFFSKMPPFQYALALLFTTRFKH
jgi:short-subunit dehydrogenase